MKLELSSRTDVALRALRFLDDDGGRRSTAAVAAAVGASPQYLPQVMAPLVRAGWVQSARGPGGGYQLDADLSRLTLRQLVEAVEGPTEDGRCVLRDAPCPRDEQCALHVPWQRARAALLAELERASLRAGPEVTP